MFASVRYRTTGRASPHGRRLRAWHFTEYRGCIAGDVSDEFCLKNVPIFPLVSLMSWPSLHCD
jgi:hypothetical protein